MVSGLIAKWNKDALDDIDKMNAEKWKRQEKEKAMKKEEAVEEARSERRGKEKKRRV